MEHGPIILQRTGSTALVQLVSKGQGFFGGGGIIAHRFGCECAPPPASTRWLPAAAYSRSCRTRPRGPRTSRALAPFRNNRALCSRDQSQGWPRLRASLGHWLSCFGSNGWHLQIFWVRHRRWRMCGTYKLHVTFHKSAFDLVISIREQ